MLTEYHKWYSPILRRDMELKLYGHAGARMIVFPTSQGAFFEWEDRGMMHALGEHLRRGWLQVYAVSTVDKESWYAYHKHPRHRAQRQDEYDRYLEHELLPFTRQRNPNPFLILAGASFGAYHALNFGLRHPDLAGRILSLSGLCDITRFTEGYGDHEVYFHNPMAFIANEHDPRRLRLLQQLDIILAIGRDDPMCAINRRFSELLWSKGIGNALRLWDGWSHDWPYWKKMILHYVGGHD
jgi:esterase/lipase superfamily enzyme